MAVSLPQVAGARRHAKIPRILPQTRCRCQESFGTPRPAENGTRVDGIRAAGLRAPLPRHPASEGHRPAAARPPVWALGLNVCSNTSRSLWKRTPKKPTILPSLRPRRLPLRRHPPKPTKKNHPGVSAFSVLLQELPQAARHPHGEAKHVGSRQHHLPIDLHRPLL